MDMNIPTRRPTSSVSPNSIMGFDSNAVYAPEKNLRVHLRQSSRYLDFESLKTVADPYRMSTTINAASLLANGQA